MAVINLALTIEATDLSKAFAQIATSELPFDLWYRERLHELHTIRLNSYEQFAHPAFASGGQVLI